MKNLIFCLLFSSLSAFGSANLAMSSAMLGADGATLTIPFTGTCQSPLSPVSGIGGFTVQNSINGGYAVAQTSVTSSGCTVTIILSEPISVDETLTVTLAPATGPSYLTDSAGNTPEGQSNVAVTSSSEWLAVDGRTIAGQYRAEGSNSTGTDYTYQINFLSADGCYRINATATQVDLFAFNYSNHWVLRQDGTTIHDWGQLTNAVTWAEQGLVTGLSGTHEYDFCAINPQNNGPFYASLVRIRITGTIQTPPAAKPVIAAGGDSITAYYGPQAITDSTLGDLYQIAIQVGAADQFLGNPGAQVCAMNSSVPPFLAFSGPFPLAFLAGSSGYNDFSVGTTPAALGACWNTFLTNMDNLSNPPTNIVVEGMLPFASPIDPSYDSAIAAAVALHPRACFVSRLTWINTTAWNGTTGDRQSDRLHIHGSSSGTGYAKVANRKVPIAVGYMSGASFAVSGGAGSGPVFSASAPFTVTLGGSNTTFMDAVTVSSSGANDIICIVGSGCGVGSVTLSANWGSHTFQYTIAPGSIGSRMIGFTGLADCWTPPNSVSFTATTNPAKGFLFGKNVPSPKLPSARPAIAMAKLKRE
jgi:hypothetical protein